MSEPDRTKIERAASIVRAFDRALRSLRLYSQTNTVLLKHQQDLLTQFSQYFTEFDNLLVVIEAFELKTDGEIIYQNTSQQESLAFRLFNDGVRTVQFRAGIVQEEIIEFMTALNIGLGGAAVDSDSVTMFWEKEFEHISYTVADTLGEESQAGDKTIDERIDEVIDPNMNMYRGTGGQTDDEDIYQDFKVTLNLSSVGKMFQNRCVLLKEDLAEIQRDLNECEQPRRLILDFVDMVLAVMQEENNPSDFFEAAQSLAQVLESNLLSGELNIARMVMDQVHQFPARPIVMARKDPTILGQTLKVLWTPERVDMLVQALNHDPKGTPEDIEVLIGLIDPIVLPHLLRQITNIIDPNRRRIACSGIARLHRGDFGIFIPLLSAKNADVVHAGLGILGSVRNEKIVDLLPSVIQHPDLSIRKEAIAILRNFRTPKVFRILLNLLTDPNLEVRVLALRILGSSQDRDIARQITAMINRDDFHSKPLQERKSYFHAVAKIAGDDFIPFLRDLLNTHRWFRKAEQEEQYQCATYALGVIGSTLAKQTLMNCTKSKNSTIRRLSQTALRILEGAAPAKELQ